MSVELTLDERARVHAALGEPARLRIVDMLLLGDASPGELREALGLTTNLIAHHLNVLADAGLITRTASEGDRRRAYVHLVGETLDQLRPAAARPVERVVFVCSANSARSQLAEALWRTRSDVPATSAGTKPATRVHPRAIRVGHRHGLDLKAARTAALTDVVAEDDFVVAVCDNAYEQLPGRANLHWSVPDPAPHNTDTAFEAAYTDLAARIDRLAPQLIARRPA